MHRSASRFLILGSVLGLAVLGSMNSNAQERQGRGGNFDFEQMREQMMERMREGLAMSADEWKVVRPLIEDVTNKQRELGGGGGFALLGSGRGRGGGGSGGDGEGERRGRSSRASMPEGEALQKAIESGTPAEIKAKLTAYREARKKKEAEVQEAREKLRMVLTAKQEAQLVLMGTLN